MQLFKFSCLLLIQISLWNVGEAIIGGNDATQGEFPYVVSLRNETGLHYCNGVLITKKHVITAAHCAFTDKSVFNGGEEERLLAENIKVLVDTISTHSDPSKIYNVEKLTPHPQYNITNFNSVKYDVAIVTLKNEVTIPGVIPIKRVTSNKAVGGEAATVVGWGVDKRESIPSMSTAETLQKLELNILDSNDCITRLMKDQPKALDIIKTPIQESSIYCGFKDENTGVCIRDSGGPMIVNDELMGMVAFGFPCALGVPDMYTPIVTYSDFINEQINE